MKKVLMLSFLFVIINTVCAKEKSEVNKTIDRSNAVNVEWNYGIAFVNGKAKYIDPLRLDQSDMVAAKSMIEKYKNEKKEIINAGRLFWDIDNGERMFVYDTKVTDPYVEIFKSEKEYFIKIDNNKTMISKDKKNWEDVYIEVIQGKPQHSDDVNEPTIYMIIRLKCKFFEGDYELIGTTG